MHNMKAGEYYHREDFCETIEILKLLPDEYDGGKAEVRLLHSNYEYEPDVMVLGIRWMIETGFKRISKKKFREFKMMHELGSM